MKPELGVCYYPEHWPEEIWAEDAQRMRASGLSWVRIGEFAWSRLEPSRGQFNWAWLDRAIETLAAEGLKIVLGTPTATPPRWLVNEMPDIIPIDAEGRPRGFGSRRHYCFSHLGYRAECARIVREVAARYGEHPAIAAWQTDNEYGCHDSTLSYSLAARDGFRLWLAEKYDSIEALNAAWGNVFWSMEYGSFEDVGLPNLTLTEANPAHHQDFNRYTSDQVALFNRVQTDILRSASPGRALIHNYMGKIVEFDHRAVAADLDIASWDSYPLGFLEDRVDASEALRASNSRFGDPDFQAFHHDLYRSMGRLWIMEQQPGPVNWAPYNPAPAPGAVRLWSWEAIAHGSEVVSYFRWRQALFAQEQNHAGLLRPDSAAAPGLAEAEQVAQEIKLIFEDEEAPLTGGGDVAPLTGGGDVAPLTGGGDVALLFDYESAWAWRIQPQGSGFDYFDLVFNAYRALRRKGLSVDIIGPEAADWSAWPIVVVPGLFAVGQKTRDAISEYDGVVLIGPRAGSRDKNFVIPSQLPPALEGLDAKVIYVETLRQGSERAVGNGAFRLWREQVETTEDVLLSDEDAAPALIASGRLHYLAGWPDEALWDQLLGLLLPKAGVEARPIRGGLRYRRAGDREFAYNYGPEAVTLEGEWALDGAQLSPGGVAMRVIPKT